MQYYQKLKELREQKNLSQEDVGKLIGTTQENYSRYERGERALPINHYITLAKYYNVSIDYMVGLQETTKDKDEG